MDPKGTIDLSQPLRGVTALESLVRFVWATNTKNETDWLEWKVGLDLATAEGRFSVAKQIIGFGNRDPSRHLEAGGCAYVVLGAEPKSLKGQVGIDPADLTSGLRRYVGDDGPAWSPLWVTVDGVDVLVITVEPPQAGDHIHTLRKEFTGQQEGTVFIRRPGGSHQASAQELRMLERRLLARPSDNSFELSIRVEPDEIRPLDADLGLDGLLDREGKALLDPLAAHRSGAETPSRGVPVHKVFELDAMKAARDATEQMRELQETIRQLASPAFLATADEETRTEEEFEAEVEAYLDECRSDASTRADQLYVELSVARLHLTLENTTIRNVPAIEVALALDGEVLSWDDNVAPRASWTARPRRWGPIRRPLFPETRGFPGLAGDLGRISAFPSGGGAPVPASFRTDNHGSTTIRFRPVDLRPSHEVRLPAVNLLVRHTPGVDVITGRWHATSAGLDGVVEKEIEIALGEPIGLPELLEIRAERAKDSDPRR